MKLISPGGSKNETVRFTADALPKATAADLQRLRQAKPGASATQAVRPKFDSMIRRALLEVLQAGPMNAYQLWKGANEHAPQLQRTAVYQFLAGKRQVGIEYAEAMMRAAGLGVDAHEAST
jgi:hypothetical protein